MEGTVAWAGPRDGLARTLFELHLLGGGAARGELTERVGCGRSVMGYLLGEMADRGLVTVDRQPPSEHRPDGGRPSHRVEISEHAPVAIAVNLGADTVRVATVALGGRVLSRDEHALPAGRAIPDVVGDLCDMVASQAQAAEHVLGVGVAVPSPVRSEDGYVFGALHLEWPGLPLRELMLERLAEQPGVSGLGVTIGNDANLAALAESRRGSGRGARQLLYLMTARIGLGGALVSEQELFTGAHGYAIEPGHVTVNPNGRECVCGSYGCLDVEADHRALLRAAGEPPVAIDRLGPAVESLLERARHGDEAATGALRTVGADLGTGIANLINLTDPDRIVLGGTLAALFELEPEPITERVASRAFLNPTGSIPISPGELEDAPLLGAAELAFQPLLADPRAVLAKAAAA